MGSAPLTEETISPISHPAAVGPRQDISKQNLSFRSIQHCARLLNGISRTIVSLPLALQRPYALCRHLQQPLVSTLVWPMGRNSSLSALTIYQRLSYDAVPSVVLCRAMYLGRHSRATVAFSQCGPARAWGLRVASLMALCHAYVFKSRMSSKPLASRAY